MFSIANYQYAFQWKCEAVTGVQRLEKLANCLEILIASIVFPNCYSEILHIMHHAGLKEVLQKLVVGHAPTCFNLQYKPVGLMVGVGVEGFLSRTVSPEKDGNANLFIFVLACFDFKVFFFEMFSDRFKNLIAVEFIKRDG